jgi:enamine deaminase RidA (YjgF/YER057c/UK114 family)
VKVEVVQPPDWAQPRGYVNGVLVPAEARLLFVAGQVAWDAEQRLVGGDDFAAQFRQALANVVAVVRAAGGAPRHLVNMRCYVTDKRRYVDSLEGVGGAWREVVGRHWPAMALVEVADLLEEGALVELEATAALPPVDREP